ncbi:restriction endonuclease subunit S [Pelagibacteraceae bacterium]|nr:restriction endonuclease subunit S [Pelagibacteraceae bacterium]
MWRAFKLGDVCKLHNGRAYKKPELLGDGKYKVLRVGNLFTNNNWYFSNLELDESKYCDNNDLLYAWSASFGPFIWNGGKVIYHYHIWRVDVNEDIIDKKFLYYWFLFDKELIKTAHGTGTTMMHVSKKSMEGRNLLIPSIPEQKRIVDKLDKAFAEIDRAKNSTRSFSKNIIALKTSIVESSLAKIDEGKHTYTLQNLLDLGWIESHLDGNHGGDYPKKNEFINSGVPYISANCLKDGDVITEKMKFLSEERAANLRKGIAKNGDVLFAHNATVGPTAILKTKEDKVILGTSLTYYRCNNQKINNEYLIAYMQSGLFVKQCISVMRQATRNQIPITKQREFNFVIPPYDMQLVIANKIKKIDKHFKQVSKSLLKKEHLYDYLKSAILLQELQSEAA